MQPGLGCSWADAKEVVVGAVNKPDSCIVTIKVHFVNSKFTQPEVFLPENCLVTVSLTVV